MPAYHFQRNILFSVTCCTRSTGGQATVTCHITRATTDITTFLVRWNLTGYPAMAIWLSLFEVKLVKTMKPHR